MKHDGQTASSCVFGSLIMAAVVGAVAALAMIALSELSWPGSIFVAVLVSAVLAALLLWIFCRPLPSAEELTASRGSATAGASMAAGAAAAAVATAAVATSAAPAAAKPAAPAKPAPTPKAAPAKPAAAAKPKAAAAKPAAKKAPAKKAAAAKPAAKKADAGDKDYDGDGVIEGKDEGTKPATLTAARGGKADDLKMIKGIGPKMEKLCNKLGFYHFDQVASWSGDEVAWVDANLEGFRGRVSRDEWVSQAKILAAGGTTDFAKKVGKGGVY